jgi:hypothetical protein
MPVRRASAVRYPALQPIHHLSMFSVDASLLFPKARARFAWATRAMFNNVAGDSVRFVPITVDLAVAKSRDSDLS